MSAPGKWGDLAPRVISGVLMIVAGAALIYVGGWPFRIGVWIVGGLMMWELTRMFGVERAIGAGALGAGALALTDLLPGMGLTVHVVLPLLLASVLVTAGQVARDKGIFVLYAMLALLGCYAMLVLRAQLGIGAILFLVVVVVVSDVAGYFAGRILGGPKFWPRVSPKKTWSGTIAGWVGAAIVGVIFAVVLPGGFGLVPIAMATAFAGQMGDIAESAVKRRVGIKDSSDLIPGHGGVLDRFDAMLAAALFLLVLHTIGAVPGIS